jgi:hypothetical protein
VVRPDARIQEQAKVAAYELAHTWTGQRLENPADIQRLVYQALVMIHGDAMMTGAGLRRSSRAERALAAMSDVDLTNRRVRS